MAGDGEVLVVGGTGLLGGQVVAALLSRGKRVRALVRPASDAKGLEVAGVQISISDGIGRSACNRSLRFPVSSSVTRSDCEASRQD
jgi:nucleoside-diphosphate-sugar epimerase